MSVKEEINVDTSMDENTTNNDDDPGFVFVSSLLTLRALLTTREAGSIIGKRGETIANIRAQSQAKIHISDGQSSERVVTVTGQVDQVVDAFLKMAIRLEEEGHADTNSQAGQQRAHVEAQDREGERGETLRRPRSSSWSVTLRLVIPASLCGCLIGKGGSKIREIRDMTNAQIQISSDPLPQSTERSVTVTGNDEALKKSLREIGKILLDAGPNVPNNVPYLPSRHGSSSVSGSRRSSEGRGSNMTNSAPSNALSGLLSLGNGASALAAIASLASSQLRENSHRGDHQQRSAATSNHEMFIPNELIGCVIGKGGSKIAEIRQISGASIRISKNGNNGEERESNGDDEREKTERHISISGSADAVALAKSLITMSVDMHKARLEDNGRNEENGRNGDEGRNRDSGRNRHREDYERSSNGSRGSSSERYHNRNLSSSHNLGELNGLAALLSQPEAVNALSTLASFSQLGGLLGGLANDNRASSHTMGTQRSRNRGGSPVGHYSRGGYHRGDYNDDRGANRRSKFTPY